MPENLIESPAEMIVKNDKRVFLIFGIVSSIPIIGVTISNFSNKARKENIDSFYANPWGFILLLGFILIGSVYMWIRYFDKNPKLLINKSGFWSRQTKLIPWENLWYLYIRKTNTRYIASYWVIIKIHVPEKEYKIDISGLNESPTEIIEAIKANSRGYNIIYLDMEEV
jgi:hypothetical protein